MVNVWIAAAGIGSTLVAALGAVLFTQGAENRRWYAEQVHLANVARADRLRVVYGDMSQAATTLKRVVEERRFRMEGETVENRDERHQSEILKVVGTVSDAGGQILVESTAKPVREAYAVAAAAVGRVLRAEQLPPGTERAKALNAAFVDVVLDTEKVVGLAREHLSDLETPKPVRSRSRGSQKGSVGAVTTTPSPSPEAPAAPEQPRRGLRTKIRRPRRSGY